jgi:hypothetical protein
VVVLGVAAALLGCRGRAPERPAELSPSDARRIADALLKEHPSEGRYRYAGIHDNGPAFLVHYTYERPCGSAKRGPPEPEPAPAAEPDGARDFTAVIDICPTASPGGTTVEVTKADGRARAIGGE